MIKIPKFLAVVLCIASINLYACSPPVIEPIPTPTATAIPTASPTPATQYSYDFPLKITSDAECDLGNKTLYEVKTDGTYNYLSGEVDSEKTETKILSQSDLNSLKSLLFEIDIAKLAEKDTPVPPGTGQTADCRSIINYTLMVNGANKTFDQNSRTKVHTSAYSTALERLKSKLDSLKGNYSYDLPFKVTSNNECADSAINRVTHEIKADGNYSYLTVENGSEKTITRKLSSAELTSFIEVLSDSNLALLAETDKPVPAGAPQTTECRLIETLTMVVNGNNKSFDRNGRTLIHTQAYLDAIAKIKSKLEELKNPSEVKYAYSLPLKITLNNECTTPVPNRTIYEVKADGTFTYIKSENDLSDVASRKLTSDEINSLKELLKEVDIAKLAEGDKAVEPGAPQTLECRTIENYALMVNSVEKTFDRNGRQLVHTQAYLDGLAKIKSKLEALRNKA
jgi:hypothetical protein